MDRVNFNNLSTIIHHDEYRVNMMSEGNDEKIVGIESGASSAKCFIGGKRLL
jgi:hypothetical protein